MASIARWFPDGYIFVFQDIRGRFKSEGQFVMQRRPRDPSDPHAIDEGTDTYDTIDWLLKNVPHNNGRVGDAGDFLRRLADGDGDARPHPALKAVSEQASPDDMFLGDDFHHNGAFRLSYGFEYAAHDGDGQDQFSVSIRPLRHLRLVSGARAACECQRASILHGKLPTWNDFVAHPNYDEFWRKQAVQRLPEEITVPDLNVAGWWDQEDFYRAAKDLRALEKHDTRALELLRRRTLEPRRLGERAGKHTGQD